MEIIRAYKTELLPNNEQRTKLLKTAGCARFAYNWALSTELENYKAGGKFISAVDLSRKLGALKKTEYPWLQEVSKCSPQEALFDLEKAFKRFFRSEQGETRKKFRIPKFKSRHRMTNRFRITSYYYKVTERSILLPRIGEIALKEHGYIPLKSVHQVTDYGDTKFLYCTVSEKAGKWFVSVVCQIKVPDIVSAPKETIGVDLGVKDLAVVSDGRVFTNPNNLSKGLKKIKRLHRFMDRKKKGSVNRFKAKRKLQKAYYSVYCQRKDCLHKMTSSLVKTKPVNIVIEDLSVGSLIKNHHVATRMLDASLGEIRRQIEYKAKWYGSQTILADRKFPSSKLCSSCGSVKKELGWNERTYHCDVCGMIKSRDLNAAENLRKFGLATVGHTESNACGDGRSQWEQETVSVVPVFETGRQLVLETVSLS